MFLIKVIFLLFTTSPVYADPALYIHDIQSGNVVDAIYADGFSVFFDREHSNMYVTV
jgi:hypothetical protein